MKRVVLAAALFLAAAPAGASPMKGVPLIPRETLFGNPDKTSAQISPDGKRISYLAPDRGVLNVWVRTIGASDDRPVTQDRKRGVRSYFWAHDNRRILYLQDAGGDENWRLYGTDLVSGETRDYTPFDGVQVRVIGADKRQPGKILLAINRENVELHDAYLLDLETGELSLKAKNPGDFSRWVPDRSLAVTGAIRSRPDGGSDFMVRDSESAPWRKLVGWDYSEGLANGPLGFSRDGRTVYVQDSTGSDTGALKSVDVATGRALVIAEDAECDLADVVFHPDTHEPQIAVFEKDRIERVVLDPSIAADVEALGRLHAGDFSILSRDHADKTWLVEYDDDDRSPAFYSYDRGSRQGTFLFKNRTALDGFKLASMGPVSFKSRDGLTIRGYLTLPPGEGRKGLPLVLLVHGGPWARDSWGYDAQAQWLANRGYACLQVNFRGSLGFGKKFCGAGDREWGGAMQNDLTDAVGWAVDAGVADPRRIAIFGGSYGGYAALAGAAFTPDLYRCAIDVVGPSNLVTFLESIPAYWKVYRQEFYRRVGNPETEKDFLRSRSPLFSVGRIRIPLLVAQGANDPRVKRAESEMIVAALKEKGIDHEYMLFPDEGHGFARPENRLKFYAAAEKFLAKHLGGRSEP